MNRFDPNVAPNPDEDHSRATLRHAEPLRIKEPRFDPVPTRLESRVDLLEVTLRDAAHEPCDVLSDEAPRLESLQDPRVLEEEVVRPLLRIGIRLLLSPMLLTLARGREGRARRRAVEHVEFPHLEPRQLEDTLRCHRSYVPCVEVRIREVRSVRLASRFDELARIDDLETGHRVTETRTTSTGKETSDAEAGRRERADLRHRWDMVRRLTTRHFWLCVSQFGVLDFD